MSHRVVVQVLFLAVLALLGVQPALAQNPPVTIQVDLTQGVHPINPNVYGVNNSDAATLNALNSPINRYGGNRTSRYNWQQNVDSTASDFFFESFPDDAPTPGGIADFFVTSSRNANAQPMITVPMIDFIAKTDAQRNVLCSFSIAKYGPQTSNDAQFRPDCGNGIVNDGPPPVFVVNDPLDANTPNSPAFQQGLVQHLVGRFGTAANGGVRHYILDNEHAIWHSTHRDVHPIGASSTEIRDKMIAFASMIKNVDPGALVVGPEEFGYTGYSLSGLDIDTCDRAQAMGDFTCFSNPPDRPNRGGMDYVAFLLTQLRAAEIMTGRRLLDVFSLHYYPQGNGVFGGATDAATQDLRSRSTRSLWDPTYVDESFIQDQAEPMVRLIPRMKEWVNTFYPGTPIAVTEYNWSAADHPNGGTTQADVLGIFGREGLDLATRFPLFAEPPLGTFAAKAFQIYRNYDGQKSTFGNVSVRTTASDTAAEPTANHFGAYGAMRAADGALTLMVVSKYRTGDTPVQVSLAGFPPGATAEVRRLSAANGGAITRLADLPVGASFNLTVPAQSVTLLVLRPQNAPPDFMLSCVPGTVTVAPGGTVTTACTVLPMLGYTATTSLGCATPPPGVTCGFGLNPVPAGGTTTLTIQAAAGAAPNAYTVTVTGNGDPFIRQTTLGVTVSATGPPPPPSSSPALALQLNQNAFRTGQEFVLRATLTPGTAPVTVDAYVLVRLPGGSMLSLTLGGGIVPGVVPIARGLTPVSFNGELLRYRFAGTEPVGSYTVTGALTVAGTGNVIGAIGERPFTFSP